MVVDNDRFQFQSTRPRGTRLVFINYCVILARVSIHASARDATKRLERAIGIFQFQSTRPRGTRPAGGSSSLETYSFNPRVRAGRDHSTMIDAITADVSIHASARDATRQDHQIDSSPCFNPRVRAGRDNSCKTTGTTFARFNPRVRAGRDSRPLM